MGQVVGKIEIGELVVDQLLAALPGFRGFLFVGTHNSLAELRLDRLVLGFLLEQLARDHAACKDLLADLAADAVGQDGVVGQLHVDFEYFGQRQRGWVVEIGHE